MAAILGFRSERFNLFLIYKSPECFLSSFESVGLSVQEKNRIIVFKMAAILDFRSERFYLFLIYKTLRCFLPSFESIDLSVQEKKRKIDFQDGHHGGHLRSPIETNLANFDLQVTPMLPTKFRVNWPFGSGEEAKNRFLR